jgi:hypothetical protein
LVEILALSLHKSPCTLSTVNTVIKVKQKTETSEPKRV